MKRLCLAILGPTASGKTGFAISVAKALGGEILCLDSTTVYQGFDIGTSKPTLEQRQAVPHHLVDELSPEQPFNAFEFVAAARKAREEIFQRGKLPILTGGSYFYLRALQFGMYPSGGFEEEMLDKIAEEFSQGEELNAEKLHAAVVAADPQSTIHPNDHYRLLRAMAWVRSGQRPSELKPELSDESWLWIKYALAVSRKTLAENISQRTKAMVRAGLVEETRSLQQKYPGARALSSIGYQETCRFLSRPGSEDSLVQQINENTRRLVKRQMTWLRSDPEIRFVDARDLARIETEIGALREVLGS